MRVSVVSAYPAIRSGLAALLDAQPGWVVAGEASPESLRDRPHTNVAEVASERPDVALLDVDPTHTVDDILDWLGALQPDRGVVLLGAPESSGRRDTWRGAAQIVRQVARTLDEQGLAFGIVGRDAAVEEIVTAITTVAGGLVAVDRRLATQLFAAPEPAVTSAAERVTVGQDMLTARELEVLQLLAQGLPNKIIAQRLHVSEHTVKFHVSSIMLKLGAASRTEAVTLAARKGLLIL